MITFPVLPLRDIVVFPHMIVPLFVGRDKSVAALEAAMGADKEIFLVAQLQQLQHGGGDADLVQILAADWASCRRATAICNRRSRCSRSARRRASRSRR
jgi:ATP-dependent Lon protease